MGPRIGTGLVFSDQGAWSKNQSSRALGRQEPELRVIDKRRPNRNTGICIGSSLWIMSRVGARVILGEESTWYFIQSFRALGRHEPELNVIRIGPDEPIKGQTNDRRRTCIKTVAISIEGTSGDG